MYEKVDFTFFSYTDEFEILQSIFNDYTCAPIHDWLQKLKFELRFNNIYKRKILDGLL